MYSCMKFETAGGTQNLCSSLLICTDNNKLGIYLIFSKLGKIDILTSAIAPQT